MAGTVLDIEQILNPDTMAQEIASNWNTWKSLRAHKVEEWKELRNYVYATDTKTTSNNQLDWSNSTTTPKLTQIHDNLHANYFAAMFPSTKWMKWEGDDRESATRAKREVIQAYMENKVRQSNFTTTFSKLLDDFILTGNVFATVEFENDTSEVDGEIITNYVGPRVVRISPYDIVFNPIAASFESTPKIVKSLLTIGEIKRMVRDNPEDEYLSQVFDKMIHVRGSITGVEGDVDKADGYVADGFSSIQNYYNSNFVEVLNFYGDIYDPQQDELLTNRIITVVDRAWVIRNDPNPSWLGREPIFHSAWRERPDNLYGMGPLDNLVGMQYRIDHLENLKADVFDQIAYPILKIKGDVEEFDYAPGTKIFMGEEGDVAHLSPDTTALSADFQIKELENKMEEMAGAPRQAMGIRTPGEKTAFEVQTLENSAGRIFQHKATHLERTFTTKVLNAMLEAARRNMNYTDIIRVLDDQVGVFLFEEITKEDILAKGKIVPVGASHFAERATRIQNLTNLWQLKLSDPTVAPHLSGKEFARILSEELGEASLFSENIAVSEQMDTQRVAQEAQVQAEEEQQIAIEQGL